jgi:hypothetical protein
MPMPVIKASRALSRRMVLLTAALAAGCGNLGSDDNTGRAGIGSGPGGLVGHYTYSDTTGAALNAQVNPQ